ncbi:MAG: hypothetical protein HKN94_04615 [Acidimicrobiales bacterium]|nr:hypothetical protein [Acidimicrobiales bacterium]
MMVDAGPLIDADRINSRLYALVRRALERGEELGTTHAVVAQVVRAPARQANLLRLLASFDIHALDDGVSVGQRLAQSGTSDVVDAHLAVTAERLGTFVLTTDVSDMVELDARYERY